jgi:hypothetical protein
MSFLNVFESVIMIKRNESNVMSESARWYNHDNSSLKLAIL